MENPLDSIGKVEFIEFLFAKERKFVKHTFNQKVKNLKRKNYCY
jgi:hypothetical protein